MALGDLQEEVSKKEEEEDPVEVEAEVVEEADEEREDVIVGTPDVQNTLIEPASDAESVAKMYERFEEMKQKIIKSDDLQKIGKNQFITKSGWRKIATAFNVSFETVSEKKDVEDGIVTYTVKAKAVAPNGKTVTGVAKCSSNESNFMEIVPDDLKEEMKDDEDVFMVDGKLRRLKPPREVSQHNLFTTAATRAKNRAISDCVGGGEVSAEEVSKEQVLG